MFKPDTSEYFSGLSSYIDEVPDKDLLSLLAGKETLEFYKSIPHDKLNYRYAEGKWCISEILSHIIDGERIFGYRALWFARNNTIELPGYDENYSARYSNAMDRDYLNILDEYETIRKSSLLLFKSFNQEMLTRIAKFDNKFASVKALGYAILGHDLHHKRIIKERYL